MNVRSSTNLKWKFSHINYVFVIDYLLVYRYCLEKTLRQFTNYNSNNNFKRTMSIKYRL